MQKARHEIEGTRVVQPQRPTSAFLWVKPNETVFKLKGCPVTQPKRSSPQQCQMVMRREGQLRTGRDPSTASRKDDWWRERQTSGLQVFPCTPQTDNQPTRWPRLSRDVLVISHWGGADGYSSWANPRQRLTPGFSLPSTTEPPTATAPSAQSRKR